MGMDMSEHMLKILTVITATVLSALIIAVGAGVWQMSNKINELDMSRELWQERVSHQLETIDRRVNGAYTASDAREDRMKTEQELRQQQRMLGRLADKLEALQKQVDREEE